MAPFDSGEALGCEVLLGQRHAAVEDFRIAADQAVG